MQRGQRRFSLIHRTRDLTAYNADGRERFAQIACAIDRRHKPTGMTGEMHRPGWYASFALLTVAVFHCGPGHRGAKC